MAFLSAARVVGFATAFAVPLILVRTFDQAEFGVYKQVFLIVGSLASVLSLGLNASLFYFLPRDQGEGTRYIVHATVLTTAASALAALILWSSPSMLDGLLGGMREGHLILALALLALISVPAEIAVTLPVVDRRPVLGAAVLAGGETIRAVLLVIVALTFGSVEAIVWATLFSTALRVLFLGVYVVARRTTRAPMWSAEDLKHQLRYALPFGLAVVFEIAFFRFHEYYVAARVTDAEFAIYAVGIFQLPLLALLVQSVADVMLVRMSESHRANDPAAMRRVWHRATSGLALVLIPTWMFAELSAPALIEVLFGAPYLPAVATFRLFSVSILFYIVIDHTILRATGDTPLIVRANIIALIACAVTTLIVSGMRGPLVGAVVGYLVGLATARLIGLGRARKRLGVAWTATLPWAAFARVIGAGGLATAFAALVFRTEMKPITELISAALVFSLTYGVVALMLGIVPPEVIRRLSWRPSASRV